MKSVMIFYAQSLTAEVLDILNSMSIRGYSKWEDVTGRGTIDGEPHYGSHAWPAKNSAIMAIIEEDRVVKLFARLRELDERTSMQGLRAYSWHIDDSI